MVSDFLKQSCIDHEISGDVLLVNRDSIVNQIGAIDNKLDENGRYARLLHILKNRFDNERFYYSCKTDEWLMLDTIEVGK